MCRSQLSTLFALLMAGLIACTPAAPQELVLMTHDSFDIGEEVIASFEEVHNTQVSILKAGDAGEVLTKAILSKGNPPADLLYGIDNTFLARALQEEIFLPYASPLLDRVSERYHLDPENRVMPVDFGFVAINYDKGWMEDHGATPPQTLEELTGPEWRSRLVVENPATSSPGLAFLMTTVARFGETGDYTYRDFWEDLKANDVLIKDGWSDAYYSDFTLYGGDRPLVVSYTTSPAAEVFYSEEALAEPPTGNVLGPQTAFLQIEGIGILKGSENEELAGKFIDFVLGRSFQEDFPTRMWVFPVNTEAVLPEVFQFAGVPDQPAVLGPTEIAASRDEWIHEWTRVMLR